MSNLLTRTTLFILLGVSLSTTGIRAQSGRWQLRIDSAGQQVFWNNLGGFTPQPFERQGSVASFDTRSPDSLSYALLQHFRLKSFLLASIDSASEGEKIFYPGPPMRWVNLRAGKSLQEEENGHFLARLRLRRFAGTPFRYDAVLKLEQEVLVQAENNGYPFATVWLDSVSVAENGEVSAVLDLDRDRFFTFKSLNINGNVKLPKAFLPNYLGFRPGQPYSRTRVLRLRDQLRSLLFVETTANPNVTFVRNPAAESGEAMINLFLQKKRASRFDFIIGLLPQPDATDGKLLLTGSLSAAFQNALNLGERFSAEIERLKPETQKLDVQASVPYLFGTVFGAEGRLGIFKRDSTWTDAQSEIGVSYLLARSNELRFFWENKTSSLQKIDTLAILSTRKLPTNLDLRQNGFGLEAAFSDLDYRFNPRRGWSLSVKAVAGFNTVRRNSQIEDLRDPADPGFSFGSLYDSLSVKAARYRLESRVEGYIPFFSRSVLKMELQGGGIFASKTIFTNENYRIGGNKRLRGFDEESLFATRFLVATAEWRLLLGQNSFLSAFADYGYLENTALQNRIFLRPLGVGAGLNFETRAGIFGISAAVGKRDSGQSFDFRATKFHLGYVSLF